MPKKKLTPSLKEKIKANPFRLKQSDYDGEALHYLKQVRQISKARKTKAKKRGAKTTKAPGKQKAITIDGKKIEPGTKIYDIIAASAAAKGQTVHKFVQENKAAIAQLLSTYLLFARKEIDNLRSDIKNLPKTAPIFIPIRGGKKSHLRASFMLHMIKKTMIELCPIYEVVFIEYAFDLEGALRFNCPQPGEYKYIEDGYELLSFIDEHYPNITYILND